MSRLRRNALFLILLVVAAGCPKDPPGDGPIANAATTAAQKYVDDLVIAAGGDPDDDGVFADVLYRYGERLESGDVIEVGFEEEPIAIDKPTWMFWHDPQPVLRFEHESTLVLIDDESSAVRTVEVPAWPVVNGGERWGADALLIPPEDVVFDRSGLYAELTEDDLEIESQSQALRVRQQGLNVDCEPKRHFLLIYGAPGAQADTMGAEARQITGLMNEDFMGVDRVTVTRTWKDFKGATAAEFKENFRNYIEEWFTAVDCCDEVIIYYIGHGYDEGVGAWGLGATDNGQFAAIRGDALGVWLRDIIDFGHGCKFMLINHSCYSAAFNQEVAAVIGGDSGTQAERGDMLLEHSSQGDQRTVDNHAGNQLMEQLRQNFMGSDGSWDSLRGTVTTAMSGFEATNSSEKGILDKLVENDAGTLGATGQDRERCCPGCGDDIVDEDEECDGEGTTCDDGDPDTTGDVCDDACVCEGVPDPGLDEDGDGIDDDEDNCGSIANPGQEDCNANDVGDACDGAMAMFADPPGDWILPEMGGQPTNQGIPQLDIEGVAVDLTQNPGAITVGVDLVQDAPPTTPGFSGIDVVFRVQNGGDQSPGLFNGGLVNLRLETQGQGQPYACKIYRYDEGNQTWQEEPLQNGMLPPGVDCQTNGDIVTFVFDLQGLPAPPCELGLSVFTQERRDIDNDNNPDLIADWVQPIIQPLPGY